LTEAGPFINLLTIKRHNLSEQCERTNLGVYVRFPNCEYCSLINLQNDYRKRRKVEEKKDRGLEKREARSKKGEAKISMEVKEENSKKRIKEKEKGGTN
jgi:hypothetical protein